MFKNKMRISAVTIGRNDNYGGFLAERFTYSLNSMLSTFDEVIYVDWNVTLGEAPSYKYY
jgi:hypothetical protein